jgi:site-specific recombinase XerC
VRKIVGVLSGALEFAVEDGRLRTNPAHGLKLPRVVKQARQYLTHDQVAALAREVGRVRDGHEFGYDVAVLTLACRGLRWSELSGLRSAISMPIGAGSLFVRPWCWSVAASASKRPRTTGSAPLC